MLKSQKDVFLNLPTHKQEIRARGNSEGESDSRDIPSPERPISLVL